MLSYILVGTVLVMEAIFPLMVTHTVTTNTADKGDSYPTPSKGADRRQAFAGISPSCKI